MVGAALMSFIPGILSYLAIVFFIWNFLNKKAFLYQSFIFFTIAIGLNIYSLSIKPVSEKFQKEWNKIGYDESYVKSAQTNINILARSIERYKKEHGEYPANLSQLSFGKDFDFDFSYRINYGDGKVFGSPFYYEKIDSNHFLLVGVGKDGLIKTQDDLIPQIFKEDEKNTGLIKYKLKTG